MYGKLASKFPDRCLFNRAERVMDGRGLTGCRSVAAAAGQSSDTSLPISASLLTAVLAEVLPGFNDKKIEFVRYCDLYFHHF